MTLEIARAHDAIDVHVKAGVDNHCNVCPDYCPTDAIEMETPPVRTVVARMEAAFDVVVIGSGLDGACTTF
ncbi:MAG: hypothetical protein IIB87_04690 [Chloroflexi bacterium]|nr:hypothetical protein [Chloroflexota bacterium]